MTASKQNRNIPSSIKRAVRQRCGFGCVICGKPLYEYDHMLEWSKVKEHKAEDITLLCDEHHKQVTNKLLSRDTVAKHNDNPFNLQKGVSTPLQIIYDGDRCNVFFGKNVQRFQKEERMQYCIPLMVDDIPLISIKFEDDRPLISILLFDDQNNLIFQVVENELWYSTQPWDIEFIGNVLTIREAHRMILLKIRFAPPDQITILSGTFNLNGIQVKISETSVLSNDNLKLSHFEFQQGPIGLTLGNTPVGAMHFGIINRYPVDKIISRSE